MAEDASCLRLVVTRGKSWLKSRNEKKRKQRRKQVNDNEVRIRSWAIGLLIELLIIVAAVGILAAPINNNDMNVQKESIKQSQSEKPCS